MFTVLLLQFLCIFRSCTTELHLRKKGKKTLTLQLPEIFLQVITILMTELAVVDQQLCSQLLAPPCPARAERGKESQD